MKQITYNNCENLLVNIIDNKQYRKSENFDNVLSYFMTKYKISVNTRFLTNLVINSLTESEKKLLDVTNSRSKYYKTIMRRINRLLQDSDKIVRNYNNYLTVFDKQYTKKHRNLVKAMNKYRKYLFMNEYETQAHAQQKDLVTKRQEDIKKIDYKFTQHIRNMLDKTSSRYFTVYRDKNKSRSKQNFNNLFTVKEKELILDLDKIREEKDKLDYFSLTESEKNNLLRIRQKTEKQYKRIIMKKRRKNRDTIRSKRQHKIINVTDLLQQIKTICS